MKNKKNDKRFINCDFFVVVVVFVFLFFLFLSGHVSEASVIDFKCIEMTELQDFYKASSFIDSFQKQPPGVFCNLLKRDSNTGVFL